MGGVSQLHVRSLHVVVYSAIENFVMEDDEFLTDTSASRIIPTLNLQVRMLS